MKRGRKERRRKGGKEGKGEGKRKGKERNGPAPITEAFCWVWHQAQPDFRPN